MKNEIKETANRTDRATQRRAPHMTLKTVIVHENLAAALRAKELADRLVSAFGFEIASEIDYWKFDWLNWSPFREQAAEAAIRADIVIFSAVHNDMPALGIQTWIESWLPGKHTDWSAVVALLGGGRAIPAEARRFSRYLQTLSAKAGIDFFSNSADQANVTQRPLLESFPGQTQNRLRLKLGALTPRAGVSQRLCFSTQ
jgi:hypothetical protein